MDELKKNKKTIFLCFILFIIFLVVALFIQFKDNILSLKGSEGINDNIIIEHYDANEFIPIYVTESDVVKKYLNDYKNNMIYDINEAYNMLNKEYREKRFGSIDSYKEYVSRIMSTATYSMEVDKYSVTNLNGMKIFNIYDTSGYQYIIKEKSIMDIEIYLDENTVIIK